jgi:hypothetical protein
MTFNSLKCMALIENLQACFEDALGIYVLSNELYLYAAFN